MLYHCFSMNKLKQWSIFKCIGSRFALMEVKAILYNLLLKFSFERYEKTQVPVKLKRASFNMSLQDGLYLEFKPHKSIQKAQ